MIPQLSCINGWQRSPGKQLYTVAAVSAVVASMLFDSTNGLKSRALMAGHSCDDDLVEDFNDTEEGTCVLA